MNTTGTWALLQNGADVNAVGKNGRTALWHYFGGSSCFGDNLGTYSVFRNHLQKLRTIGLPISDENELLFKNVEKRYEKEYMKTEKIDLRTQCEEEREKLKKSKLDRYNSLFDVIFKRSNQMAMIVKNDDLKEILADSDFEMKYPMYGFLLKLQFRRGSLRRVLLESAKEAFELITQSLPDSCIFEIFKYLSDKNLKAFTKALS